MRRGILVAVLLLFFEGGAMAQHWTQLPPDAVVPATEIAARGADAYFIVEPINDTVFRRMSGRSYKAECTLPRAALRYLRVLHYGIDGQPRLGELVCNRAIAEELKAIFRQLYESHYIIERMVLIDEYDADDERSMAANNTSAFNFRFVSGTKHLSNHSRGMAVDINPLYNPYVYQRSGRMTVEPAEGRAYADRTADFPCKIDTADLCYKEFSRHGFVWGGNWNTVKDYQHFEKK